MSEVQFEWGKGMGGGGATAVLMTCMRQLDEAHAMTINFHHFSPVSSEHPVSVDGPEGETELGFLDYSFLFAYAICMFFR